MKKYQLTVRGIRSGDLSSIIDLVHDIGGEVGDFEVAETNDVAGPRRRVVTHQRAQNAQFKLGPAETEIKRGVETFVMQAATKFAATQKGGIMSRKQFMAYCNSLDFTFSPKSISPCISNLLGKGVLEEI